MALTVPGRKTIYVLHRARKRSTSDPTKWARDSRGNAVYETKRIPVANCSVQPQGSSEQSDDEDGRTQHTTTAKIFGPLAFPADLIDSVEIDGEKWDIMGDPIRWEHPRLGHVEVDIRKAGG